MKLINRTPHPINIYLDGEKKITYEPMGEPIRLSQRTIRMGEIPTEEGLIPLSHTEFGKVEGLPKEREGIGYIVSRAVAEACPDREDLFIPNESVRDEKGRTIGCESLSRNPFYRGRRE